MGEIMIAFSLMTLFVTSAMLLSATMTELRNITFRKLENLEWASKNLASTTVNQLEIYGNNSIISSLEPLTTIESDYDAAWGRETCNPRLIFKPLRNTLYTDALNIGSGNKSTDIEARHGVLYLTADSSSSILPDVYIIDWRNPQSPVILSSLHTGPGLSALEVAGTFLYAASLSTTNQLQIIDISNRYSPVVVSKFKLPLPNASSTAPLATAIFYSKGKIYLGTEKWDGKEFSVIDVSVPDTPRYLGGFETNTLVSDIYVHDSIAYVAASDVGQMRILDVSDPTSIIESSRLSPSGWETQEGKVTSYFEGAVTLGRTTGGYNVFNNHEIFLFSSSSKLTSSRDIPGGVYGIVPQPEYLFVASRASGQEFQVWDRALNQKVFQMELGFSPRALVCDENNFFFATGDEKGAAAIITW